MPLDSAAGVIDADPVCELTLERVDVRTERGDPIRVKRIQEELTLSVGRIRWGKVDAFHGHPCRLSPCSVFGRHEAQLESQNKKEKAANRQRHQCE